jgi:hypothetical protein
MAYSFMIGPIAVRRYFTTVEAAINVMESGPPVGSTDLGIVVLPEGESVRVAFYRDANLPLIDPGVRLSLIAGAIGRLDAAFGPATEEPLPTVDDIPTWTDTGGHGENVAEA